MKHVDKVAQQHIPRKNRLQQCLSIFM